jgi:tetratricopeptide (TPR) repeat protein
LFSEEISDDNVTALNDMGFFKEQAREYEAAIRILEPITARYPSRAVAFLNLADSYYGAGREREARKAYARYMQLLKEQGKGSRVPQRVFERI